MTTSSEQLSTCRLNAGRKQRGHLGRAGLSKLSARKSGFDPIALLLHCDTGRIPALLPLKYRRMAASPFSFFRGSVGLMAYDLARDPDTRLTVQLCGDAHVQNLGSFEAPDGRIVFDINDFDETIAGPWEWDVKRMAASIFLAGLESGHAPQAAGNAAEAFAAAYCATMEFLAGQPMLAVARHQIHREREAQAVSAALRQAERANPGDLLNKYTEASSKGGVRFRKVEHVLWRLGARRARVLQGLTSYKRSLEPERQHLFSFFQPVDVAFKVVGTGSVGLRDYVILMQGNGPGDPLFLQIKQEVASAYAPYLAAHVYSNHGQRAAQGQRMIQPLSDLMLGWTRIGSQDYLVRQLNDHKGSIDIAQLKGEGLHSLASIAGELLARGHARSGDAQCLKGYIGAHEKVVHSIGRYAQQYAERVHSDFTKFQKAIAAGRVKTS